MIFLGKEEDALAILNKLEKNADIEEAIEDCHDRLN